MESTYIRLRIVVVVALCCNHSTPLLCGALAPQCPLVVVSDVLLSMMSVKLTAIVLPIQLVLHTAAGSAIASDSDDGFASDLALSLISKRRLDFSRSEWLTRFEGRIPSFLSLSC